MEFSYKYRRLLPEIDENSPIGLHIRRKRLELGWSQDKVGELIGVVTDAITGWELERYEPKIQYIPKIFAFLGYYPISQFETKTFGGKVKLYRVLCGLSHRKMAKVLKADPGTIANWENNKTLPPEPRLGELTALLQQKIGAVKKSGKADLACGSAT